MTEAVVQSIYLQFDGYYIQMYSMDGVTIEHKFEYLVLTCNSRDSAIDLATDSSCSFRLQVSSSTLEHTPHTHKYKSCGIACLMLLTYI